MQVSVADIATAIGGEVIGDGKTMITGSVAFLRLNRVTLPSLPMRATLAETRRLRYWWPKNRIIRLHKLLLRILTGRLR